MTEIYEDDNFIGVDLEEDHPVSKARARWIEHVGSPVSPPLVNTSPIDDLDDWFSKEVAEAEVSAPRRFMRKWSRRFGNAWEALRGAGE